MAAVIYNVTVNVSEQRVDEWLQWMSTDHIPQVLASGLFMSATLVRVIGYEQGGKTFAVQYHCDSMQKFERYENEYAPDLRARSAAMFGEDAHAFRTVLEIVQTFSPN